MDSVNDPLSFNLSRRLVDEVYNRLREAIVTGYLKPGARVIERELTDKLGVSRTPIREALKLLEQEFLVVGYPHKGYFVRCPTFEETSQAYELRREIEGFSAQLAAERATDEELELMAEAIHKSREALQCGDLPQMLLHNNEFHRLMVMSARNSFLLQELNRLWAYVNVMRGHYWVSTNRPANSQQEHEEILSALCRRDGATARRLNEAHIERAWQLLCEKLGWQHERYE